MNLRGVAPALVCSIVWGSTFCVASEALAVVSPVWLMLLRFVLAYAVLWIFCRQWQPLQWSRSEALFLLLGLTGGSGYFLLEFEALRLVSSADVGIVVSSVPLLTVVLLWLSGRESLRWGRVVALLVGMLGVALVVGGGMAGGGSLMGHLLSLAAALSWACYSLLLEVVGTEFSPLFVARRLFFWALVTLLPFVASQPLPRAEVLGLATVGGVLYLGGVASALCVWLWGLSTVVIGARRTNAFLLLMPVVALLLSADGATVWNVLGAFVVVGALAYVNFLSSES